MNGWIFAAPLLALVLVGGAALGWLLVKRPLAVWAWGNRRALVAAGLKKVVLSTASGPQTVFVGGSGPVLVLLHGAGDQAGTWQHVAKPLAARYTLVIPDLAGHGDSAPSSGPIETSAIFGALETLLAEHTRNGKAILVGNSLGAWMATVLALRHPDQVERVVAVNGGPLRGTNTNVRMLPTTREDARQTMAQLRDPGSPAIPDPVLDDMVRQVWSSPLARFAGTVASMDGWLLTEDQLRDLRVPVRLVWGVSDQLMPMDYARRMLAVLPDVQLIPIERCGHIPQQEAPDRFRAALEQALGPAQVH